MTSNDLFHQAVSTTLEASELCAFKARSDCELLRKQRVALLSDVTE
jgi:hypothetical protein